MPSSNNNHANICFTCQNCCGGCSWSRSFIPVPGWKATETSLLARTGKGKRVFTPSYNITFCPEYLPDDCEG